MVSFKVHSKRLSKMASVIERLDDLEQLPYFLNISEELIDSLSVSQLVDYVTSNINA